MAFAWLYLFSTQTLELYLKLSKTKLTSFPSKQLFLCLLSSIDHCSLSLQTRAALDSRQLSRLGCVSLISRWSPGHTAPAPHSHGSALGHPGPLLCYYLMPPNDPHRSLLPPATRLMSFRRTLVRSGESAWISNIQVHLIQSLVMIFRIKSDSLAWLSKSFNHGTSNLLYLSHLPSLCRDP